MIYLPYGAGRIKSFYHDFLILAVIFTCLMNSSANQTRFIEVNDLR